MSNSVCLVTGPSGAGKTSLIATAAKWLYKNHGKVLRLYTADGGGFGTGVQALVQAGLIQVFRMRTRAVGLKNEGLIEETCMRVSQGWWPREIDPGTGDVPAGVEMVPPTSQMFILRCPNGHEVQKGLVRIELPRIPVPCPTCAVGVVGTNPLVRVDVEVSQNPGFDVVGGVAIEGLTSMADWVMLSLADRVARNELGGEKSALGGTITSGSMQLGNNNRSHYGFAQGQAEKWLLHSISIPNLVMSPIWTGLETRVDEEGALPFYGPSIPGTAKIGKVPQWVGNYLGAQVVMNENGEKEWRLYLTEYRGQDGVPHLYKTRAEPSPGMAAYLCDQRGQPPFSGFNLGKFFDLLEEAKASSLSRVMAEFPGAPGLPKPQPKPILTEAPPVAGDGMPRAAAMPPPRIPQAGGRK